ncbi:Protein disulfide-isomerase erp38 [Wickerhamiella sorbophila]|uniref:Protein disulfide-isomerase erp38 n=1 Tax=Wickerhamiella sorbophila TaxID=45607 RepID=A0A2T0FGH2_9ASCO|nr:Protein disulfide-isomerase erp38 [Wickerhamiella sorbophila]PRT54102.1 Protein disulfide-isomerase erp38 [Wickerhamiella sorbophila]
MVRFLGILQLIFAAIASARVIDVSDEDFGAALRQDTPSFVLFYSWTHDAVPLNGYYSDISRIYEDDELNFLRIDITENPKLAERYGISKVPSVVFIRPGSEHNAEVLQQTPLKAIKRKIRHDLGIDHTNEHTNYPLKRLSDNSFRLGIQGKHALVLFVGTCTNCDHITQVFRQIAADYKHNKEVAISEVESSRMDSQMLPSVFSLSKYPTVLYFSKEGSQIPLKPENYHGDLTYEALTEFLESRGVAPTGLFGQVPYIMKRWFRKLFGTVLHLDL